MKIERHFMVGFLALSALLAGFVQNDYLLHILVLVLMYSVLASSLNLIIGYVGEFPLGHVAFFGLGAYSVAILSSPAVGWPVTVTIAAAALIAAAAGYVSGV